VSKDKKPAAEAPVLSDKMIAIARVQVPSLGLLFFGMLGMFTIIIFALDPMDRMSGMLTRAEQRESAAEDGVETPSGEEKTGEDAAEVVPVEGSRLHEIFPEWLQWVVGSITILAGLVICLGAWRMRHMQSLKLARWACLLAILPLNPLCCMSMVFGVWGAIVLFRDDIEEHFES
jgi:hypothetical protein